MYTVVYCAYRTRDANELAQCDVVVDVGGVYDPARHHYDHHQRCTNYLSLSLSAITAIVAGSN